jgi:hypothetical protein
MSDLLIWEWYELFGMKCPAYNPARSEYRTGLESGSPALGLDVGRLGSVNGGVHVPVQQEC